MLIVLNILIIFFVGLIAYWWANQGAFSAIIHLLCVITAAALALAFWEPLTVGLLLRGGWFDSYAWGFSLVGLFSIVLLVLRLVTNKVVPANVDLPHSANLAIGGLVGAASGILSVGILVLGAGFIQSERSIMGYVGHGRSARDGQVRYVGPNPGIWVPVHKLTDQFFSFLSVHGFSTSRPLRQYSPDLYQLSASLVRDSAKDGRGQVSMPPEAVRVVGLYMCPQEVVVTLRFERLARDFNDQLTLSASQIRLISEPQSARGKPHVAYPVRWTQETSRGTGFFQFDDISHYITSVPGRESAEATIAFPYTVMARPRFLQIKGGRIALPQPQPLADCSAVMGGTAALPAASAAAPPTGGRDISSVVEVNNQLARIQISSNNMPGGLKQVDRYLTEGDAIIQSARSYVSRDLRIQGIFEPRDTKIVQVDVSRNSSPADIFGSVRQNVADTARPVLVDTQGNTYSAIGYIHERPDGVRVWLDPRRTVETVSDLPQLPSAGTQSLKLVFRITEGVTLVGFKLGDMTVGTCNIAVEKTRRGGDASRSLSPGGGGG